MVSRVKPFVFLGEADIDFWFVVGATILDIHCTITRRDNRLVLIPHDNAAVFVNGNRVQGGQLGGRQLVNGDRVALGEGESFFAVSIPNRERRSAKIVGLERLNGEYWRARAEFIEARFKS